MLPGILKLDIFHYWLQCACIARADVACHDSGLMGNDIIGTTWLKHKKCQVGKIFLLLVCLKSTSNYAQCQCLV